MQKLVYHAIYLFLKNSILSILKHLDFLFGLILIVKLFQQVFYLVFCVCHIVFLLQQKAKYQTVQS